MTELRTIRQILSDKELKKLQAKPFIERNAEAQKLAGREWQRRGEEIRKKRK